MGVHVSIFVCFRLEKKLEMAFLLVEFEYVLLVLCIHDCKSTTGFVVLFNKPFFYEANHIAPNPFSCVFG